MPNNFHLSAFHFTLFIVLGTMISSCSTVSHLPADELLYTGTRSTTVTNDNTSPLHDKAVNEAKVAFISPPNNALFGSSRYRTPLPLGLWAYNAFVGDSTGLRHWLFRTFATQPIYISTVNPAFRAEVAENTLHNYGYFDCHVAYSVDTLSDGRKAKLSYTLHLGEPWRYGEIVYREFPPAIDSLIRSTWSQRLLREGDQVSYATLSGERNRLFMLLREQGYYYFRPEMITLLADTTKTRSKANLRITTPTDLPPHVTRPWYIGHTFFTFNGNRRTAFLTPQDTLTNGSISYLYQGRRIPIRQVLLTSRITYRQGDLYSSTAQNTTQRDLNRLGILSGVSINYIPRDSIFLTDTLDVYINTALEPPYELSLEANLTAKSNDQVGPNLVASLSHKNLLRMAETIQLRLKGSYEWQTNRALRQETKQGGGSSLNSFELGADLSMSVPQLLFPGGYDYPYERPVSTTARLYTDWLHRGGFFRMLAFGGNLTYAFSTSDVLTHSITPFSLTFNKLEHTTTRFDSIMTANPAIGLSFRDQFVPSASYTITYNETNTSNASRHPSRITFTVTSAGALTSLVYAATGHSFSEKEKSLLGTPYAQFIKGYVEACRYYHLVPRHTLATRLIAGGIYAYGNASHLGNSKTYSPITPFSEQFHAGGANDIRAFPLRGIGPGSYHSVGRYAYINHTGDVKLEVNAEWRFPLVGQLSGALFLDAGNVWTLRHVDTLPGGQLRWKTLGQDIALGTGFGLRYNLRILLLRADVGIPLHAPYDTGKRGYYNIPRFSQGLCFHLSVGYPF